MKLYWLSIFAGIVLIEWSGVHAAGLSQYEVYAEPANIQLTNNGVVSTSDGTWVNDEGETLFQSRGKLPGNDGNESTLLFFVNLPQAAHGLPAGNTMVGPALDVYLDEGKINNQGEVAADFGESVFLWLPQPAYGLPAGTTWLPTRWGWMSDINDSGQVLGYNWMGHPAPFIWSAVAANGLAAGMTNLTALGNSMPMAMNNAGSVVAVSSAGKSLLYVPRTSAGLRAGSYSLALTANDINDSEVVVGTTSSGAALWSPSWGLVDLNSLIPINSGWHLSTATQINDLGQIIGTGTYDGQAMSFLLTVPEPGLFGVVIWAFPLAMRRSR
ncbi:MAG TPA: hypothetical protein VFE58_13585 [Tepidisphaeraceae bacterium]|jgi:uncharacterized membrane protein|nr:hypothetical protein [Tepidisphaeraceae bacterium]